MITKEDIQAMNDGQLDMFQYWGAPEPTPEVDPRDKTTMDMVKEYAKVAEQVLDPLLSFTLVSEEYQEWIDASVGTIGELKELADLVYVIYGYANAMDWDLDMALLRVHENNMGRMYQPNGTIQRRADGKIMKNKDYPKVELGDLV